MNAPKWTENEAHERATAKAAHVIALHILNETGQMPSAPKTDLAQALGVSRWTLDRYLATLEDAQQLALQIVEKLK